MHPLALGIATMIQLQLQQKSIYACKNKIVDHETFEVVSQLTRGQKSYKSV